MAISRDARTLHALFDVSFTEFVTPKVIRLLYVLALGGLGLGALFLVGLSAYQSLLVGLGYLIVAAVFFLFFAILIRVVLETALILFRIADNTAEMAEHGASIAMNTGRIVTPGDRPSAPSSKPSAAMEPR